LGVGGDLSANAVRRLDRVIAQRPDRVIVLIGSNDIMASVFPNFRRFVRVIKRLRDEPTAERFDENLAVIVRRLQREADARIALSSLAPVGEEPGSRHPVQARLNDLFSTYNGIIRKAAAHPCRHRDKALGEGPALVKQRLTCDEQTQNRTARAVRVRFCVCSPG